MDLLQEADGEEPRDLWESMGLVDGHEMQLVESMIVDHLEQDTDAALQSDDLHSPQSAESIGHGHSHNMARSASSSSSSFGRSSSSSNSGGGGDGAAREGTRSRSQSRDLGVLLSPVGLNSRDSGASVSTTNSSSSSGGSGGAADGTVARGFC